MKISYAWLRFRNLPKYVHHTSKTQTSSKMWSGHNTCRPPTKDLSLFLPVPTKLVLTKLSQVHLGRPIVTAELPRKWFFAFRKRKGVSKSEQRWKDGDAVAAGVSVLLLPSRWRRTREYRCGLSSGSFRTWRSVLPCFGQQEQFSPCRHGRH